MQVYQLQEPAEIVRQAVLSSISWNALKLKGTLRTDAAQLKAFFQDLPREAQLIPNIAAACRCSPQQAETLLQDFCASAWKYIAESSIDSEIVSSVVLCSENLRNKAKELIYTQWQEENQELLQKQQQKQTELEDKLKKLAAAVLERQQEINQLDGQVQQQTQQLQTAAAVEKEVADRIQRARRNAAAFIAEMAFFGSSPQPSSAALPAPAAAADQAVYRLCSCSEAIMEEKEELHSWADVVSTLSLNLEQAGTRAEHSMGLAAFLCAAFIEKQPLLLIGPNAADLVQACSAILGEGQYGLLNCTGPASGPLPETGTAGEKIVLIQNLFSGGWPNRLPEITARPDIFYLAVHPFAEDIQVEPPSLYNFMLPLFTQFFVDHPAQRTYYGGQMAADFQPFQEKAGRNSENPGLRKLRLSALIRTRAARLLSVMHAVCPEATADADFLFAVLPLAWACLAESELQKQLPALLQAGSVSSGLQRELAWALEKDDDA